MEKDEELKACFEYEKALKNYKRAVDEYYKMTKQIENFDKQIHKDGYYSISGIKIDMPYLPSTDNKINTMMELLGDIDGKLAADLGCGDGKILLALMKKQAIACGFELESSLIEDAHQKLQKENLDCTIFNHSFFDQDLSCFDVLTVYGITSMMDRLEEKLQKELHPGAVAISNTFAFPNWRPEECRNSVYKYIKD